MSRSVRILATATLISRHVPRVGGRHDFALSLIVFLLGLGRLDEATTLKIVLAAWHAAGADSREAVQDLKGIVRDTAEKLAAGEPVVGGPTLEELAPGLFKLQYKWWGWGRGVYESPATPGPLPWPELAKEALYGLPGDVVRAIEPHCEADPVAILTNALCALCNLVGRVRPRGCRREHHTRLFVGLVGNTAKGRKGLSWGPVRELMGAVDPEWADNRIVSGLSSGEGLIYVVRDDALTSQERYRVYKMLRLKVLLHADGSTEITGMFGAGGSARFQVCRNGGFIDD